MSWGDHHVEFENNSIENRAETRAIWDLADSVESIPDREQTELLLTKRLQNTVAPKGRVSV